MTITSDLWSHTIFQKSAMVSGNGPCKCNNITVFQAVMRFHGSHGHTSCIVKLWMCSHGHTSCIAKHLFPVYIISMGTDCVDQI